MNDPVNHPSHYATHPSGVEVIEFTRHFNFNVGNAMKYVARHNQKGKPRQDLEKAIWYLKDETANGTDVDVPVRAIFALGIYTGVEEYLIKNDPGKATLCNYTNDALVHLSQFDVLGAQGLIEAALARLA